MKTLNELLINNGSNKSDNVGNNKAKKFADEAYRVKDWVTLKGDENVLTMEEALASDSHFRFIDVSIPAEVVAKEGERKGKTVIFYKLRIFYKDGGYFEYDLPYNRDLLKGMNIEDGTEFDTSTLGFYIEEKLGVTHKYALGKILEEK